MNSRPTGIIRSLPYNADSSHGNVRAAYKELLRCLRALNTDDEAHFFVGMAQRPIHDVLHIYIIERCGYCGEFHEIESLIFAGQEWKTCPQVPVDQPVALNFASFKPERNLT